MFQKYHLSLRDLKNFFRCSYYRITNKLQYPERIIPRHFYKAKIDIQGLLDSQALFVTRRLDVPFEKAYNKLGNEYYLRQDALDKKRVPNMSMNLMGGKFKEKDIPFSSLSDAGSQSWIHPNKIFLDEFIGKYKIYKDYSVVYFTVSEIHNMPIPYLRPKDKNSENLVKALANKPKLIGDKYEFYGRGLVQHSPTNLNYWHIEYEIRDSENNVILENKSRWQSTFCESLISDLLVVNGFHELVNPIVPIGSKWFKNRI